MAKSGYNFLYLVFINVLNFRPSWDICYHSNLVASLEGLYMLNKGEPLSFPHFLLPHVHLPNFPLCPVSSIYKSLSQCHPSYSKVIALGNASILYVHTYPCHSLLLPLPRDHSLSRLGVDKAFIYKDYVANILGFVDCMLLDTTTQLCHCSTKAA